MKITITGYYWLCYRLWISV